MQVQFQFQNGIICGDDKRFIEENVCYGAIKFRQRKSYDEYYYDPVDRVELTMGMIKELSEYFGSVIIYNDCNVEIPNK
mgnify:CR=1 FL=1